MKRLALILMLAVAPFAQAQDNARDVEAEARELGKTLRCVVCQNESIEESNAELATDMRRIVRDRLRAGETPDEVRAYMQDRYGDYVLLKPPVQANTAVLWFAPALLVLGMGLWLVLRRRPEPVTPQALSEDERAALEALRR